MAMPKTDSKGRKLRFIRKNGKVIPIYSKDNVGQVRATGIAAQYGKKKGEFSRGSKNSGIFVAKGSRERVNRAGERGSSSGFKIGAAIGGAGGAALATNMRGARKTAKPFAKKAKYLGKALKTKRGLLGAAIVAGGAALVGGMLGSGFGYSGGRSKQLKKEVKSGNITVFKRRGTSV